MRRGYESDNLTMTTTRSDDGFSLIELLVVMLIVGVLAAIAIPTFLTQRAKAHDSATRADVSAMGKEIATYFVDNDGPLTLDWSTPGQVDISDGGVQMVARLTVGSVRPSSGASRGLDGPDDWCVALTDPAGSVEDFRYSARAGLEPGTCT